MKNGKRVHGAAADGVTCASHALRIADGSATLAAPFLWAGIACAASLTPVTLPAVGSSIYDPNTGTNETVVSQPAQLAGTPFVQVSNGDVIFAASAVDDSFAGSNGHT